MVFAEHRQQGLGAAMDTTITTTSSGHGGVFSETFDVVVVGYGFAGAITAIEAHDAGARVLLIEKMPFAGGISILSGGAVRCAVDAEDAFSYLKETSAGTTPDDVLRVLADGMAAAEDQVRVLAERVGARINEKGANALADLPGRKGGNYPFAGWKTFYNTKIDEVPNFDRYAVYPRVRARPGAPGPLLFRVVEQNVALRDITVRFSTSAVRLIHSPGRGVQGLVVRNERGERTIKARRAVVLACGGFEGDPAMQRQFWQTKPVLTAATRGNTGDGIRMAQECGAALWHMWLFHGAYAFRHPDPDFPFALRVKRLPDWNPLYKDEMKVKMAWIVVDQRGRRYMNECPPYMQDTSHRPMEMFDPETMRYPRIPSFLIADENGRRLYPLGDPRSNDPEYAYDWSDDNMKEIELGILQRADSIAGLAKIMDVDAATLGATIERWNAFCARARDEDFGRPPGTMMPIEKPPFIVGKVWPTVSNTQGGPVHNARQQVIDVANRPIPRLYTAGELGSAFGHLYLSGGNVAECFVTGRVAGHEASALAAWDA
jgi:succinate dehydrogenase/fumarate reductase flavoprotein subunit